MSLAVFCADVGSVAKKNFGWARLHEGALATGSDIAAFANALVEDLNAGRRVALGFECPLFVPITEDPRGLTAARPGEGDRAWSAGAGAGSLVTGLTETVWILDRVRRHVAVPVQTTTSWDECRESTTAVLFVWEAFVTKDAKADTHHGDAELGVRSFVDALPEPMSRNAVRCACPVRSLIGAAVLQSGLSSDLDWLRRPCLVVRVLPKSPQVAR
jgi:hypothetical protein